MAAKNIHEAVKIGCKDLIADQDTLIMELRDFFSHQVMIFEMRKGLGIHSGGVKEFFDHIFKEYPTFKGVKK